jgi:hypothetical protein
MSVNYLSYALEQNEVAYHKDIPSLSFRAERVRERWAVPTRDRRRYASVDTPPHPDPLRPKGAEREKKAK